jgi:hypothetical protein
VSHRNVVPVQAVQHRDHVFGQTGIACEGVAQRYRDGVAGAGSFDAISAGNGLRGGQEDDWSRR